MVYLSQTALKNLKVYAYRGVDKSLLSRYVLGPYWNWFITLWPLTVAPNTVRSQINLSAPAELTPSVDNPSRACYSRV
ncbi:hypothetical protein J3R83DRAFT_5967 [Lanmaoa asiatica]|nr:hypothetical protein J3R83DRAFT_5967 [Lanmaoa asiatica]